MNQWFFENCSFFRSFGPGSSQEFLVEGQSSALGVNTSSLPGALVFQKCDDIWEYGATLKGSWANNDTECGNNHSICCQNVIRFPLPWNLAANLQEYEQVNECKGCKAAKPLTNHHDWLHFESVYQMSKVMGICIYVCVSIWSHVIPCVYTPMIFDDGVFSGSATLKRSDCSWALQSEDFKDTVIGLDLPSHSQPFSVNQFTSAEADFTAFSKKLALEVSHSYHWQSLQRWSMFWTIWLVWLVWLV